MRTEKKGRRILLVEDNEKILRGNERMFRWEGYDTAAATLREARALLEQDRPDAIVLDVMLPDGSGLDLMAELRAGSHAGIPVLLLTGMTAPEDIVRGLDRGGDDYLTKPYDFAVLLAHTEALLRRAQRVPEALALDGLTLNVAGGKAALDGRDLLLTQKEFALLLLFVQNPERYIDGEYLYEQVWTAPLASDSNALKSASACAPSSLAAAGSSPGPGARGTASSGSEGTSPRLRSLFPFSLPFSPPIRGEGGNLATLATFCIRACYHDGGKFDLLGGEQGC